MRKSRTGNQEEEIKKRKSRRDKEVYKRAGGRRN